MMGISLLSNCVCIVGQTSNGIDLKCVYEMKDAHSLCCHLGFLPDLSSMVLAKSRMHARTQKYTHTHTWKVLER